MCRKEKNFFVKSLCQTKFVRVKLVKTRHYPCFLPNWEIFLCQSGGIHQLECVHDQWQVIHCRRFKAKNRISTIKCTNRSRHTITPSIKIPRRRDWWQIRVLPQYNIKINVNYLLNATVQWQLWVNQCLLFLSLRINLLLYRRGLQTGPQIFIVLEILYSVMLCGRLSV